MTKSVQVRIEGKVQGVWFRAWTEKQARALALKGWVRNCPDGSVQALFSGPAAAVDQMVAACHGGPPNAQVTSVTPHPAQAPDQDGFQIRRDG
ncbi:acylphosphatase [Hwanghaeella sp. 1Z406]|jgi:acylphosphatase|uniref:acylphosphatase n=1 Tax=Hwanghaeella sp. 1Z406 TaxID=3402811 RepID=UPI003B67F3F9|tara:strand:- start:21913 stop:22191 length:279 start_codon:yes stop_codon:yes gene_type:complete